MDNQILNKSVNFETNRSGAFHTPIPMTQTAGNLLQARVNHIKKLNSTMQSDNVRSGDLLPNAAAFTKKRSITRFGDNSPAGG